MKLSQLRHVIAIEDRGSLRAASRHTGVAQSGLTRSLRDLEREIGTALFERHPRGMVPTPAGTAFLRRVRAAISEIRRAEEEIGHFRGGIGGTVTAALSIVPHVAFLPRILGTFRKRFPDVSLQLIEGVFPIVENQIRDGSIDFYIGPRSDRPINNDLFEEILFDNERIVLGRKMHPLRSAGSLAELVGTDWATTSVTLNAEDELTQIFARHGLPAPRLRVRTQSALSLLVSIVYSDTLAIVPVQWKTFEPFAGSLEAIPIRERLPGARIVVVRRAGLPLTPAAQHMLDMIRRLVDPDLTGLDGMDDA